MGWDFTRGASKADIVAELVKDQPRQLARTWSNKDQKIIDLDYDMEVKTIAHKVVRNTLWAVREHIKYKKGGEERFRYIRCCLLKDKRGYGWGYKDMSEMEGPFYYDCPLEFLDLAPVACEPWRKKVREYHGLKEKTVTVLEAYQHQARKVFIRNKKAMQVTVNDHIFKRGPNNTAVFVRKEVRVPKKSREDFHADG